MADTTLDPEKLRRERELLLTPIDPSPWIAQYQREMEAEALWELNDAAPAEQPASEETQP